MGGHSVVAAKQLFGKIVSEMTYTVLGRMLN